jgi:hypothetical protein
MDRSVNIKSTYSIHIYIYGDYIFSLAYSKTGLLIACVAHATETISIGENNM